MAIKTFKSVTRWVEGVKVESESRGFKVVMDEPVIAGGTDTGMTPMEMILAGLGGCQTITAAEFAKAKGVDLQDVWVEIEGDVIRPADRAPRLGFVEVRYKMHFKSTSSEEKLREFVEFIEKSCPVGDTFAGPVKLVFDGIVIEE